LYGSYPKKLVHQKSEYEEQQVGPKYYKEAKIAAFELLMGRL
jgi:hypothetical protein